MGKAWDKASDTLESAKEKLTGAAKEGKHKAEDVSEQSAAKLDDAKATAKEDAHDAKENASEKANSEKGKCMSFKIRISRSYWKGVGESGWKLVLT